MGWNPLEPAAKAFASPVYSLGAKSSEGWIHTAGLVAIDETGQTVGVGDIRAQARHVIETIRGIVETGGGTLADVCFVQVFIKTYDDYAAFNEVYRSIFETTGAPMPPRFCIKCDLVKDDWLVEMTAAAKVG